MDVERRQPLLHRIGEAGATIGTKPPRSRSVRLALQIGLAVLIFGFLVLTVIDQWSEIQDEGVHFHVVWLIPAIDHPALLLRLQRPRLGPHPALPRLPDRVRPRPGRLGPAAAGPLRARQRPLRARPGAALRAGRGAAADHDRQHRLRTGDLGHLGDRRRRLLHHQPPRPAGRPAALGGAAADPGGDRCSCTRRSSARSPTRRCGAFGRDPLPAVIPLRGVIAADRLLLAELGRGRLRHLLRRPLGHLHPLQRHPPGRLGAGDRLLRGAGRRWSPRPGSASATPPSPGR